MNRPTVPNSVSDSDWQIDNVTSITGRGIVDFNRVVGFAGPLSDIELSNICAWLHVNRCPGWTGVYVHKGYTAKNPPNTYTFRTTMDSSD